MMLNRSGKSISITENQKKRVFPLTLSLSQKKNTTPMMMFYQITKLETGLVS